MTGNSTKTAGGSAIFACIAIPFSVIGSIGNLIILIALLISPLRKSNSVILIISLTINNFLYSTFALPPAITSMITGTSELDAVSCRFFAFFSPYLTNSNCSHQAAIAVNRVIAILGIHHVSAAWQKRVTFALLLASWGVALAVFMLPLFDVGGAYGLSKALGRCIFTNQLYSFILAYRILFQVIPFVIIVISYVVILAKIRQARKAISPSQKKDTAKFKSQVRITKNTFGLGIFYFICFLPYSVWNFVVGDINHDPVKNLGPSLFLLLWCGKPGAF